MKHPKFSAVFTAPFLALLLSQCVVPYESARMLPKGEVEIKGAFTHARVNFEGESEKLDNGLGVAVGYGVSEKFNVKLRSSNIVTGIGGAGWDEGNGEHVEA